MAVIRIRRVEGAPVVAVRVWLPGGSGAEQQPGQALVSGRLLLEGTGSRDWRKICEDAERRGIALASDAGYEAQGLSIDALADDWELALTWAAELARESVFPEDRCRWLARQAAAELEQMADHPDVKTSWAFDRQLFGDAARGRPLQGSVESLRGLDAEACRRFHRSCLDRGAIVAVAGDLSEPEVEASVRHLFGDLESPDWSVREASARAPAKEPDNALDTSKHQLVALEEVGQAHWFGGTLTVSRAHPDYWALGLLGIVLGAGGNLSGRISHRVRELEGLAYSCAVATTASAGRDPGCFAVSVGTSPESVDQVEAAVTEELETLFQDGVTAQELQDARAFALGRAPFQRETARQWANLLAQAELFGAAIDDPEWVARRWRKVSLEDMRRVARRYLDPGRIKVTVGSAEAGAS